MVTPSHLLAASLGMLSALLGLSTQPLQPSQFAPATLVPVWNSPWVERLVARDPVAESLVQRYVDTLGEDGWILPKQGVWVQAGTVPIAHHQGEQLLPAASLTKLATTLSALTTWDPNHQFETRVGMTGTLEAGVLQGDLIIQGGGDPLFVWEEAIVLGNALQQMGIQRVTGNLVILDNFIMNFETDPYESGERLKQAFNSALWPTAARQQFATLPPGTPEPMLVIDGTVQIGSNPSPTWLVRHQSLPMVALLKAMNIYSNNVMAQMMADLTGGAQQVTAKATQTALLPAGELSLVNGSGLGTDNQMTARAAVEMLEAIQAQLEPEGFSVVDVLPVSGEDWGTLKDRNIPLQSAVKTGSLAEVSALAGVIPTAERGPVWFAIINYGWDLETLRRQQDALLQGLQQHWGAAAMPARFQPKVRLSEAPYQLGDPQRNQVVAQP